MAAHAIVYTRPSLRYALQAAWMLTLLILFQPDPPQPLTSLSLPPPLSLSLFHHPSCRRKQNTRGIRNQGTIPVVADIRTLNALKALPCMSVNYEEILLLFYLCGCPAVIMCTSFESKECTCSTPAHVYLWFAWHRVVVRMGKEMISVRKLLFTFASSFAFLSCLLC